MTIYSTDFTVKPFTVLGSMIKETTDSTRNLNLAVMSVRVAFRSFVTLG